MDSKTKDELKKRVGNYNGKNIQLSLSYAPIDMYLYKDGYKTLLHHIKTSPVNLKKFLAHHHITPLHKVLKYKNKNGKEYILSDLSIYEYINQKLCKYINLSRHRSLTFYEKSRYKYYIILEDRVFPWIPRLIKNSDLSLS